MRKYSNTTIAQIIDSRKKGLTLREIMVKFNIPKTSVWHHIRYIKIDEAYLDTYKQKVGDSGGSKNRKILHLIAAKNKALELLKSEHRELVIAFAMLYWAEGTKSEFAFTNSDGNMIKLYMHVLRNVLNIPDEEIKPFIRYFTGMNRNKCLRYWTNATSLSASQFKLYYNDGSTKGNTEFGLCRVRVKNSSKYLKLVKCIIEEYYNKQELTPRSSTDRTRDS